MFTQSMTKNIKKNAEQRMLKCKNAETHNRKKLRSVFFIKPGSREHYSTLDML